MRPGFSPVSILAILAVVALATPSFASDVVATGPTGASPAAPLTAPSDTASYAAQSRAHALVQAAINMTNSDEAVKLLWQATDLDPTLDEPYIYLALFYNSRSQFDKEVEVYQKLIKYKPSEVSAYLNIGEAYMSYSPPKFDAALPFFRKALEIEPGSSIAALRVGEIYAQQGNRDEAVRYLKVASDDRVKNPNIAGEADEMLRQISSR